MMRLKNMEMIRLMPDFLQSERFVRAFCKAADEQFQKISCELKSALIYVDIDGLPENILDMLAHDLHVDFYRADFDIEKKRELVRSAARLHGIKGTNAAIEELIDTLFGDGEVEEWFQYGGEPYHFRVWSANISISTTNIDEFMAAINSVKRESAWLDGVFIRIAATCNTHVGVVVHTGEFLSTKAVNVNG